MRKKSAEAFFIPSPRMNQHQILKHLATNAHLTQAELARRCDLSVAMVNNYMKELCKAALLEYHRKSTKNVSYHLTEEGHRSLSRVETALLQEIGDSFESGKERFRERILSQSRRTLRRVVLFGSGHIAQLVFLALESTNISVIGICDDDPSQIGRDCCGRKVLDPSHIPFMDPDAVIIASVDREEEIYQALEHLRDFRIDLIKMNGGTAEIRAELESAGSPADEAAYLEPVDVNMTDGPFCGTKNLFRC
jgi:predicted transcriptional regulator